MNVTNSHPQKHSQDINISGGELHDVDLGGQAGRDIYRANGHVIKDSTFVLNNLSEQTSKQEILSIIRKRENDLKVSFQGTLKKVGKLISELRLLLEDQLQSIPDDSNQRISKLIEEIERLSHYQSTIESIDDELEACYEAADWLRKNRREIADLTTRSMLRKGGFLAYLKTPGLSVNTMESRFSADIKVYLEWIHKYIRDGVEPENDIDKEEDLNFDFASEAYKEAFIFITDEIIDPKFSNLSDISANMLASYVNNYLIDDDNHWGLLTND